jgi:HSP20 family protein
MLAVKLNDEKTKEALIRRPGFEVPLFRGSLFNMNPFTLMRRFTEDLDRAFGTVSDTGETLSWSPTVEVKEVNGKFLVSAELPGLKKGDIKVQVTEDALIRQLSAKLRIVGGAVDVRPRRLAARGPR